MMKKKSISRGCALASKSSSQCVGETDEERSYRAIAIIRLS